MEYKMAMGHNEQAEILKKILDLEVMIADNRSLLLDLEQKQFRLPPVKPEKPVKKQANKLSYPDPKSEMKFTEYLKSGSGTDKIIFVVLLFVPIANVYILFKKYSEYSEIKRADIERIKNTKEYKIKCEEIDKKNSENQANSDAEYEKLLADYQKKLKEYENIIIPQYQKDFSIWRENHNKEIESTQCTINQARSELVDIYEETKILPIQYRKIETIKYIYEMVSTSDYDVKEAINKYDQMLQRQLETERLREQQIANENQEIANQIAAERNEIAAKARRDANISAVVGAVQRHNTNKILKGK